MVKEARFFVVATPIGNLGDITLRAIETFKNVDLIFCEDTRRTAKLMNHLGIQTPLRSAPYFKEQKESDSMLRLLAEGKSIALVTDAGTPGLSDPGSIFVKKARDAGYPVEVVAGVSALTHFLAGLGYELSEFHFCGFLPAKTNQKKNWILGSSSVARIFLKALIAFKKL